MTTMNHRNLPDSSPREVLAFSALEFVHSAAAWLALFGKTLKKCFMPSVQPQAPIIQRKVKTKSEYPGAPGAKQNLPA